MGDPLLEFVSNSTFANGGKPAVNVIAHAPVSHILDFCLQTIELSKAKELPPETSIFTHSASLTLGGGRFPCNALDCRLEQIDQLAQFAALYSEKVYIKNPFVDHLLHLESRHVNESALKQAFADDVQIYIRLIPLIEAGIVIPITPPSYCAHCLLKNDFGSDAKKRLSSAYRDLTKRIRNDLKVSVVKEHGAYQLHMDGGNFVFDHPTVLSERKVPKFLRSRPRLLSEVNSGKSVAMTCSTLKESKLAEYLAGEVMESLVFELSLSQCLRTSFLINRESDREFLRYLTVSTDVRELDSVIQNNLTALVPFLRDVAPKTLLKLRKGDEESFILFRNALRRIVGEYPRHNGGTFTPRDAQMIYGDILEPELARLTKKLQKAKKTLVQSSGSTIAGWTAALSVGAFTGLATGGIVKAAAALGLTKVLAHLVEKTAQGSDTQSAIRDEELYFLWRVKREADRV